VFFPGVSAPLWQFFSVGNQPVSNVFSLHLNAGFFFGFPVGVVNFVWLPCWKKIPKKGNRPFTAVQELQSDWSASFT